MQRTRREILYILKRKGQATLEELSSELGLVPMTVRAHLNVLEKERLVKYEEKRRKIGRPHFVYSLTAESMQHFPQVYDLFANRLIEAMVAAEGESCCGRLANQIGEGWASEHRSQFAGRSLDEQVEILTQLRSQEGALADLSRVEGGYLIRQRHCPVFSCASKHPAVVCQAELVYFNKLLDTPVERRDWMLNGDSCCTFFIPDRQEDGQEALQPALVP